MRPNFLDTQRRNDRLTAFLLGGYAGVAAALMLAALTAWGVESWNDREERQTVAALNGETIRDLNECKAIVRTLGREEYATVLALYRQTPEGRRK